MTFSCFKIKGFDLALVLTTQKYLSQNVNNFVLIYNKKITIMLTKCHTRILIEVPTHEIFQILTAGCLNAGEVLTELVEHTYDSS